MGSTDKLDSVAAYFAAWSRGDVVEARRIQAAITREGEREEAARDAAAIESKGGR